MLKDMTKTVFDEHLNTKFLVKLEEGDSVNLELIKTEEKKNPGIESFSLIFKGLSNKVLYDDTYTFEHDKMGTFKLFISPYIQKGDSIYYDVVFTKVIDYETE